MTRRLRVSVDDVDVWSGDFCLTGRKCTVVIQVSQPLWVVLGGARLVYCYLAPHGHLP